MSNRRLPDDRFKQKKPKKPNTLRLFLGIFPPDEYVSYFRDILRSLDKQKRNLKATPVDQLHLTVKFIGSEVSIRSKDLIYEELTRLAGNFPRPEIQLEKVQFGFPYQQDPKHVLVMVKETQELKDLYNVIHDRLKELRLFDTIRWKMQKGDNFHITMARVKPKKAKSLSRDVAELVKNVKIEPPSPFKAEYIDLVESDVTATGPVYRRLGRIKL